MSRLERSTIVAILNIVCVLCLGIATQASAGRVDDAVQSAIAASEQGRCDEVYRGLSAVEGLESRGRLLAGQCEINQGRYTEALDHLDQAARSRDLSREQVGDVALYRGVALFHLERYSEADEALASAGGLTREEAQLDLYRGLIALRRGDPERAAPALESAARRSPAGTEPVASYYAGLAWQGASERAKARDAFARVVALDPDGPWGAEAERLLDSTRLFPAFARLTAGVEYDDNVILRGAGTDLLPSLDGDKDWRGIWLGEAGIQLYSKDEWAAGLIGSYSGTAHYDLADFNTHYPTIGAWVDRRLGPQTNARATYNFGHAWVDEEAFLRAQYVQLALDHTWERAGTTEVATDVSWNDFRFDTVTVQDGTGVPGAPCPTPSRFGCGPPGLDEGSERDRDGVGFGLGIDHRYLVSIPDSIDEVIKEMTLRGGYRIAYYDSQGKEWQHLSNRFVLGFEMGLPFDLVWDVDASYERRDFDHPSTFPDNEVPNQEYSLSNVDRKENEVQFATELEKGIGDHLSVSARWAYTDSESNRSVYDYQRHIVGGYVKFRWD